MQLIDLPGVYSLQLDLPEASTCRGVLDRRGALAGGADRICVVVNATNLVGGLRLVGETLGRGLPMVVAVNMIDVARRRKIHIDAPALAAAIGCEVVPCSAATGEGLDDLQRALAHAHAKTFARPAGVGAVYAWAQEIAELALHSDADSADDPLTERLDNILLRPALGGLVFAAIMGGLFWTVFKLATYPMGWIDAIFRRLGGLVDLIVPAGAIHDLLAQGVVGGVSATVIFLPQICILFFLISLLEDTGYLARATLLMDRLFRPFGLPGQSFVPLLSSHACALPGIIACRGVPDRRERLATILVAPFMTCSARIPVYVLLTSLLFPRSPGLAALAFAACYVIGAGAGLFSALLVRRTLLPGASRPMAIELPSYKIPSLLTALSTTYDRAMAFMKKAGTVILAIMIVLWWLGQYPTSPPPQAALQLRQQAALVQASDPLGAKELTTQADRLQSRSAKANSFIGKIGHTLEPVFRPLGYDWRLTIGLLSSLAAREVFVSTMSVVVVGEQEIQSQGVMKSLTNAKRDDGVTPIFTRATAWSLLIYYVLAMQCMPTLAMTAREAGGARWAVLQFVWMSGMAYLAALAVHHAVLFFSGAVV